MALFGERDGSGLNGHASGSEGGGAFDDSAFGENEFEGTIGELGERRAGLIFDKEVFYDVERLVSGVGLDAHHIRFADDTFDVGRGVVDVDVDGLRARGCRAEVVRLVVGYADKMKPGFRNGESVAAARVRLGAGEFLHTFVEVNEDYVVSGGRLVAGLVGDDTGDGVFRECWQGDEES